MKYILILGLFFSCAKSTQFRDACSELASLTEGKITKSTEKVCSISIGTRSRTLLPADPITEKNFFADKRVNGSYLLLKMFKTLLDTSKGKE